MFSLKQIADTAAPGPVQDWTAIAIQTQGRRSKRLMDSKTDELPYNKQWWQTQIYDNLIRDLDRRVDLSGSDERKNGSVNTSRASLHETPVDLRVPDAMLHLSPG